MRNCSSVDGRAFVVMPKAHTTLDRVLMAGSSLMTALRFAIAHALCRSLLALHAAGFVHNDIKAENCACFDQTTQEWRLIDLDGACRVGLEITSFTPRTAAPEVVSSGGDVKSHPSQDLWSMGAVLFHVFSGQPLFVDDTEAKDPVAGVCTGVSAARLSAVVHPTAHKIVHGLLHMDAKQRTSLNQVARWAEEVSSTSTTRKLAAGLTAALEQQIQTQQQFVQRQFDD